MSTNYFQQGTYNDTTGSVIKPPDFSFLNNVTNPTLPSSLDPSVMGFAGTPNYASRNLLLGQMGPQGSINQRYTDLMRARRDAAAANLRRYGGVSFLKDDPNTPQDESLTPNYEKGLMGDADRDAYNSSLSRAAASGVVYSSAGDQMIGAALQRTSDEARAIVSQYASDMNAMANQKLTDQNEALSSYLSLYKEDAAWFLENGPKPPKPPDPKVAPPDQVIKSGGTVAKDSPWLSGRTIYSGTAKPNLNTYRTRFKASDGYRVSFQKPAKKGGKWKVIVTYFPGGFRPASSVPTGAGSSWDSRGVSTA